MTDSANTTMLLLKRYARYAFITIVVTLCLIGIVSHLTLRRSYRYERNLRISYENAHTVIEALAQYHEDHKQYPASLDELVPDYLETLPLPQMGCPDWEYHRERNCVLRIKEDCGYYAGYYIDVRGQWYGADF